MALSKHDEMIIDFVARDVQWAEMQTKEPRVEFFKMVQELGLESATYGKLEYAPDLTEEMFKDYKKILHGIVVDMLLEYDVLTTEDVLILRFIEANPSWETVQSNNKLAKLLELAKTLGIDDIPDIAEDMTEEAFNSIKDDIFGMGDGLLSESLPMLKEALQNTQDDPEIAYYEEVAATIEDNNEEATVESVENYNNFVATEVAEREENNMNKNTNGAMNNEEMTMGQKAKAFAEAAQDKITDAADYIMENVPEARETIKEVASMNSKELEIWLRNGASNLYETIKEKLTLNKEELKGFRKIMPGIDKDIEKHESILKTFSEIMDDEDKNGWGKFKSIVAALVQWLIRVIIRAAQIALKIAVVLAVGAVKIGAVAIDTTISAASILHKEVVKPAFKSAKRTYNDYKERKAAKAEWDAKFEEYSDEEDFDDDNR